MIICIFSPDWFLLPLLGVHMNTIVKSVIKLIIILISGFCINAYAKVVDYTRDYVQCINEGDPVNNPENPVYSARIREIGKNIWHENIGIQNFAIQHLKTMAVFKRVKPITGKREN